MELMVGTKAWSSWSLRPWLALRRTGAPFTEVLIGLRRPQTKAEILTRSPSGRVPALRDGDLTIWDSLAICEYLAEKFPQAHLWPADPKRRALARAATAEMHSGFAALRQECAMDLAAEGPRTADLSEAASLDVRRIASLWQGMLQDSGGPFLFGEWSIADAFYTPMATRFRTYGIRLADHGDMGLAQAYGQRLLQTPDFLAWEADARRG